jgi:hypothetical protein
MLALASGACAEDRGTGTVRVTTWGEEYIEQGLGEELFPKDGWSVKYTKFLVVFGGVRVADGKQIGAELSTERGDPPQVFDLTRPGEKLLGAFELDAKAWPDVSYTIGPITQAAQAGELTPSADVALAQEARATMHVEGVGTSSEGERKTFRWSFSNVTAFERCHGEQGGKEIAGVSVSDGGNEEVQLTMHGDHFFYDDLQADDAVMRFQALADADADADGEITLRELDDVPLFTIPPELGPYGTGALGNVDTLGDYQRILARTVGHYRGEGSCDSRDLSQ